MVKDQSESTFFISEQYWTSNYELVKEMLPQAEVYVYEDDKIIQGFVGVRNEYIEGILFLMKCSHMVLAKFCWIISRIKKSDYS